MISPIAPSANNFVRLALVSFLSIVALAALVFVAVWASEHMRITILLLSLSGSAVLFIKKWPEFFPILYFSSYIFKGILLETVSFFNIVDFTILISSLSVALTLAKLGRRNELWLMKIPLGMVPMMLFTGVLAMSHLYTISYEYGGYKLISFIAFNLSLFFVGAYFPNTHSMLKRLVYSYIFIAIFTTFLSAYVLYSFIQQGELEKILRLSFLGVNPIAFSAYISGALLCIIILWDNKWRLTKKLLFFLCATILFSAALLANSRGPMLSFLIVIGFLFLRKMIKQPRFQYILIFFAAIAFVIMLVSLLPENLTNRYDISQLTSNQANKLPVNTVATRLHFWSVSIDMALKSPQTFLFGNGIGSFVREIYTYDFRWYPHNIFFEILSEQGMVGLVIFLFLIGTAGFSASRIIQSASGEQKKIAITFLVLLIYFLLCAQFSGDLNDNRRIWFIIGLIGAQYRLVFGNGERAEDLQNAG